jgi:aryl-alcohol dehydrogenase-like predicted oxidoreductase
LGTALWGWGIEKQTAFELLSNFYKAGWRCVDTATNYPINKDPLDFRRAETWIEEWIRANSVSNLRVLIKVGAVDNSGSALAELSPSFLLLCEDMYRVRFGANLRCLSIHWDNRSSREEVTETAKALSRIAARGLEVGLSGIKHPGLYANAVPELANRWWVQVKENVFADRARRHYCKALANARFVAYGINAGGIKFDQELTPTSSIVLRKSSVPKGLEKIKRFIAENFDVASRPENFNQFNLLVQSVNTALCGLIIGPRNINQLTDTLNYWAKLNAIDKDKIRRTLHSFPRLEQPG